jgi:phosphoribosylglycinamide formyltransferase-1
MFSALRTFKRLAVFCSGNGTNFRALYFGIREQNLPCEIVLCVSNNAQCGAMKFAHENGIETLHLAQKNFPSETMFEETLVSVLRERNVDFILLAGYLKKIPANIIAAFEKKILNIHPALLPKYGGDKMFGMNVHRAVIANNETISGATVHFVNEEYDEGEILLQRTVDILPNETPESLAEKVLRIEHQIYVEALSRLLVCSFVGLFVI